MCSLRRVADLLRSANLILLLFISPAVASSGGRDILVEMDYAQIIKLPSGAQTLAVGNPLIADFTLLKNNQLMVVTGKAFGVTNLIVIDQDGSRIGEYVVTVVPPEDKLVIYRGPGRRESFSCHPYCAQAIDSGDHPEHVKQAIEASKAIESVNTTAGR